MNRDLLLRRPGAVDLFARWLRLTVALTLVLGLLSVSAVLGAARVGAQDDDEATPESERGTPSAMETYESELYGYTLSYDPEVWEITETEDPDPDDDYDYVEFTNGTSFLALWGDPDYDAAEMDRCLVDYTEGLFSSESISDVTEYEAEDDRETAGSDDGVAFATYVFTVEDEDEPFEAIRYLECRALENGVTVIISHDILIDDYEGESEARDELLEGLEDASDGATPAADDATPVAGDEDD